MHKFTINGIEYHPGKVLVIAELGTSHGADPVKARELVSAAAEAGADCVKFQMVYADEILHPRTGFVTLPGGQIPLYDVFKQLETPLQFYADLKAYVESLGLLFLCTPFGPKSARKLRSLNPAVFKIASPELNYASLLEQVASFGLPTFLSSGVSKLGDIEEAITLFGTCPVCILHCVTAYPAPEREYNLRLLPHLSSLFGVPTGVSDHSLDPELVPVLATALGAAAIEKHFCLSREDPGLDDPIALPPSAFAEMTAAIRDASARAPQTVLDDLSRERGAELVAAILGDGVKRLAPAEQANYGRTNRSLHALRDIQCGEVLEAGMVGALRTEKILRPGLPPSWEQAVLGRTARARIPAGEGIRFEDI
ncbi:spore coat protein [Spirochaetia bacterium]|nr:spore coat protein [Spirochaetia bacterium]